MDKEARTEYMALFEVGGAIGPMLGLFLFTLLIDAMPLKDALVSGIILSSFAGLMANLIRK